MSRQWNEAVPQGRAPASEKGVCIVSYRGEIDFASREEFRRALQPLVDAAHAILDLRNTKYIDSLGIAEILRTSELRRTQGKETLRLAVDPESNVARVVTLSGVGNLMRVHPSLEEARR